MPKTAVTTLTVAVNYDPELTDADSIAAALDTLMETALDTPDVLDEVGNPAVGAFYPIDAKVENFAPDMDAVNVTIGDIRIVVERNENGETEITVHNTEEGTHTDLILGQEGETQRV